LNNRPVRAPRGAERRRDEKSVRMHGPDPGMISSVSDDAAQVAGKRLGPFEIVRELARGGMGQVYVARDVRTDERVAVKVLAVDAGGANAERFEREGRIAEMLQHPHIVRGLGAGRADDGKLYLAMELLAGEDLDARLSRGSLHASDAVAIAMQVCEALEYAHAQGVVHRDLKPQNIFLREGPQVDVCVLDFGIARLAEDRKMTATGSILGTFAYMSPEQSRGDRALDARTDIWSLGIVLYECLAGRLPFDGANAPATLFQILFEPAPDLATLAPGLPPTLVESVSRAIRKSRDERFPSARAMRDALAGVDRRVLPTVGIAARGAAPTAPTAPTMGDTAAGDTLAGLERRLTSVVHIPGAADDAGLISIASEMQGRAISIDPDLLVVFGIDRWIGDEPQRAARLALAAAADGRSAGVATGRVLRSASAVAGAAVTIAVELSRQGGARVDGTTLALVRSDFAHTAATSDGGAQLLGSVEGSAGARSIAPPAAPLVGRSVEIDLLVRDVDAAVGDLRARCTVALGSAGVGKTRVRREALTRVRSRHPSLTILGARCEPYRRDTPYAALIEALGPIVQAHELAAFTANPKYDDPVASLDATRETVQRVLERESAAAGLLLYLDNAQWLDTSSRDALRWILDNCPDLPIAVWAFARTEARDAVVNIARSFSLVELGPLDRTASAELLHAIAPDAPDALLERAAGHPLFLEELGRLYAERGPATFTHEFVLPVTIEGALLAQLDLISAPDREFVKRAAVFGNVFWQEGVEALGGDAAAVTRMRRANLIAPRSRQGLAGAREFTFRTSLLADVAYNLWPDEQRPQLHALAAQWLSSRSDAPAHELARHWDLAGDAPRAAESHARAAEAAAQVADVEVTRRHVARALELTDDPRTRFRARLADDTAALLINNHQRRAGIDDLVLLAKRLGPSEQAEVALRETSYARLGEETARAEEAGARAVALAESERLPRIAAMAHREMALLFADQEDDAAATMHADAAKRHAEAVGDPAVTALALSTTAYVAGQSGAWFAAAADYERAADLFARAGLRRREAQVRGNAAHQWIEIGRLEQAAAQLERVIDLSTTAHNARARAVATSNLGVVRRLQGDRGAAETLQVQAASLAEQSGHHRARIHAEVERIYGLLESNAAADVIRRGSAELTALADSIAISALRTSVDAVTARAAARAGDPSPVAIRHLVEAAEVTRDPAARIELLAAAFDVSRSDATIGARLRDDLGRAAARIPTADRPDFVRAWMRRYLVPATLAPEIPATA